MPAAIERLLASDAAGAGLVVLPIAAMLVAAVIVRRLSQSAPGAIGVAFATAAGGVPTALLFGTAGAGFALGSDGAAVGLGIVAGLALAALVISPTLRDVGGKTMLGAIGSRFGGSARLIAATSAVVVSFGLLAADFALLARLIGAGAGISVGAALGVAVAGVLVVAFAAGDRVPRTVAIAFPVVLAGVILPLVLNGEGPVLPAQLGQLITDIGRLELDLIERELADITSLTQHAKPFLRLDPLDVAVVTLTIVLGLAALPSVVAPALAARSERDARLGLAWATAAVALVVVAAPGYAALAKRDVLRLVAAETPLARLPAPIVAASRADAIRIHGVSLAMLQPGMYVGEPRVVQGRAHLDPEVARAVGVAAAAGESRDAEGRALVFGRDVMPVAARAAGNTSGRLTYAGVEVDPSRVMLVAVDFVPWLAGLIAAGVLAAGLAAGALLAGTIGDAVGGTARRRGAAIATGVIAAGVVAGVAALEPMSVAVAALAVGAATLFSPLLALAVGSRAPGSAVAAGQLAGAIAFAATLAVLYGLVPMPAVLAPFVPVAAEMSDAMLAIGLPFAWAGIAGLVLACGVVALAGLISRAAQTGARI